jgi:hypothetical protein
MCVTGVLLAATAVQVAGQVQQGREAKAMGEYQAAQAQADADAERGAARVYADKIRKAGERARGEQQAALAASGASLDSASADEIDRSIVSAYEEDALVAMYGGDNRARSREAEGRSASIAGNRARRNALIEAAGTAASGWSRSRAVDTEMRRAGSYDTRGLDDLIASRTSRPRTRYTAPVDY